MKHLIEDLRARPQFRAALVVPTVITLIFSLFNLTAAPDPARIAAAVNIGFVKLDTGMTFPPIKVSDRLQQGLSGQMPFSIVDFADETEARSALEREEIAAFIIFPEDFSKQAFSEDPVQLSVVGAGNLTVAEARMAEQLPMMLQSGIAAAVNGLRLALAKGQIPSGAMPVELTSEIVHPAANPAASLAPFVSAYTIWLGGLVGAVLMFFATSGLGARMARAKVRSVLPVVVTLVSSLLLSLILTFTSGIEAGFIGFWAVAWALSLAIAWACAGIIALARPLVLILLLPLVFYQGALGGTQMPAAAAPSWLDALVGWLPFEHVGALLRSQIIGGSTNADWMLISATALGGLVLIYLGTILWEKDGEA